MKPTFEELSEQYRALPDMNYRDSINWLESIGWTENELLNAIHMDQYLKEMKFTCPKEMDFEQFKSSKAREANYKRGIKS